MKPDAHPPEGRRDTPGVGRTERAKENVPGPRLPHERDESADSQQPGPPPQGEIGERAYRDAERGRPDTGRAPVLDRTYNDKVARR